MIDAHVNGSKMAKVHFKGMAPMAQFANYALHYAKRQTKIKTDLTPSTLSILFSLQQLPSSFKQNFFTEHNLKGICKTRTGWLRMADADGGCGWRMADGGWENADGKMRMTK